MIEIKTSTFSKITLFKSCKVFFRYLQSCFKLDREILEILPFGLAKNFEPTQEELKTNVTPSRLYKEKKRKQKKPANLIDQIKHVIDGALAEQMIRLEQIEREKSQPRPIDELKSVMAIESDIGGGGGGSGCVQMLVDRGSGERRRRQQD